MKYYIFHALESSGNRYFMALLKAIGLGTGSFFDEVLKLDTHKRSIDELFKGCIKNNVWGSGTHNHRHIIEALDIVYPNQNVLSDPIPFLYRLCPDVKFISLIRLNKLKHAVSWVRAENIGFGLDTTGDSLSDYSDDTIFRKMQAICDRSVATFSFFDENNIKPLYITYEELCDDNVKVAKRVLQFLEIPVKRNIDKIIRSVQFAERTDTKVRDALYARVLKTNIWR